MAGLFDKQAEAYLDSRPTYLAEWYSMLADRTSSHSLAWDVGTGNGQAAIGVSLPFIYSIVESSFLIPCCLLWKSLIRVFCIVDAQLKLAKPHALVRYVHTPLSLSDDELVKLIGGENCVDLVTVAEAVHWFDLPRLYSVVNRVLRKPDGAFAVWGYNDAAITPEMDTLPFPFKGVGLGSEGSPLKVDIPKEVSFDGVLGMLKSWSAVILKREREGLDGGAGLVEASQAEVAGHVAPAGAAVVAPKRSSYPGRRLN
ncbi:hypothetical protein L1987_79053 [Smallanthus sonchifolius]|uniref:Uncharacterized protein n=1 Tax=Smallanthus sonchifolius TaxID=185202 RepID=A0ACB8ZDK1_9ASTR|nr:hypothetical protein L1987_79053 [Smallanthus sonchifolius]